ncbi:MAG: C-GCAxxG-C-C family protein [Promethearchaeota archaeon]
MEQKMVDIDSRFEEELARLKESLPKEMPAGCAEATLRYIFNILGIEDQLINNIMISLSGGFGGYKSEKGWSGPCGAVVGGCAAVGAILGGKEKEPLSMNIIPVAYMKSAQFAKEFENEFGSVICPNLSGFDFSKYDGVTEALMDYIKEGVWGKTCHKYVLWAIDNIRKLMKEELKEKW